MRLYVSGKCLFPLFFSGKNIFIVNKDLIISSRQSEVDIALLEEKRLVEIHKESPDSNFAVGDIYLGKVKKIAGGLNAAFVEVGHEKDAFLHYFDLGPQLASFNKYTKSVLSENAQTPWLKNFQLEKDIDKEEKLIRQYTRDNRF